MKYDIIIIGAGAAGLMAATDLSKAGKRVCVLEAASRAGGRMATKHGNGFTMPVETGAEFVHGDLPLTLELLTRAGIPYLPVEGEMVSVQQGKWNTHEAHDKHWAACMRQLKKIKTDMSIDAFLQQYFATKNMHRCAMPSGVSPAGLIWLIPRMHQRWLLRSNGTRRKKPNTVYPAAIASL